LFNLRQRLHNGFFLSCFLSDTLFCHGCSSNNSNSGGGGGGSSSSNNSNNNNNNRNNNNSRSFKIAY
jgi:hypothetical protein